MKNALQTRRFDAAEYLDTPEAQAEYSTAAFEAGDEAYIKKALNTLARAQGKSDIAKTADVTRQALYKGHSENGESSLSTLLGLMKALGVRLSAQVATD